MKGVQSLRSFQTSIKNKLMRMEEAIMTICICQTVLQVLQGTEDERDYTIGFVTFLLKNIKNRVTTSEKKFCEKEAIIDYLTT